MLEKLREINEFPVYDIADERFLPYGRVIRGLDVSALIRCAQEKSGIPENGNIYVASFPAFEEMEEICKIQSAVYGGLEIQAGFCNGRNSSFNAFEYHKSGEVNIAVTDLALALGHSYDITDDLTYDADRAEVFYVPKGTVLEMYGTTLHFSPLKVSDEGFKDIIILPLGTNTPLSGEEKSAAMELYEKGSHEGRLLLQKSKWVIAHPEWEPMISQGAWPGVTGPNKELKY